jgi:hypothetical protein
MRVKPLLTDIEAEKELRGLVKNGKVKSATDLGLRDGRDYIVVSDGIYAPIVIDKYGDTVVTSILTQAGLDEDSRIQRNKFKRGRKAARRLRSKKREPQPYKRDNTSSI